MQISFKIDSRNIPYFKYILLRNENLKIEPHREKNEAFRVRYKDSLIVGYYSGSIVYQDDPEVREIIRKTLRDVSIQS